MDFKMRGDAPSAVFDEDFDAQSSPYHRLNPSWCGLGCAIPTLVSEEYSDITPFDHRLDSEIIEVLLSCNALELDKQLKNNPPYVICSDENHRTLLHLAACKEEATACVQVLLKNGSYINAQDDSGNTALHLAAESCCSQTAEMLLTKGASTHILNQLLLSPIHIVSADPKRINVLKIMEKYKEKVDVLVKGANGRTALHVAAIADNFDGMKILLNMVKTFCLYQSCANGYTPLHEAARHASTDTLTTMLQWGEKMGKTSVELMSFQDKEGNTLLHSAIHGGDIQTVQLCLQSGAKIGCQKNDLTTAVHLACSMGLHDIVTLMFSMQPEEKLKCLNIRDAQNMMPLHYAAMFDHSTLVEFLVAEGADINVPDGKKRSALLLAASHQAWKSVAVLLHLGANVAAADASGRNIVHYIIRHHGNLEEFATTIDKVKLCQLLNTKDLTGCTPLHYSTKGGQLRSTENLLRLGASVNSKNNWDESPLHFAAKYGRLNTVLKLLNSDRGQTIINETNGKGLTPLHVASEYGQKKMVHLLLARGALLQRDHQGRSPLHLAAINGYTQTMELLLTVHSHLLNKTDKDKNTPLHLAAKSNRVGAVTLLLNMNCKILRNNHNKTPMDLVLMLKHSEAAMAMATHEQRGYEILRMNSEKSEGIIQALIALMPEVYIAVLDQCIKKSNLKQDSEEYYIKYSFKYLQYSREMSRKMESKNKNFRPLPLPAMNTMVDYKRLELLCHPVCQKYIQMKWHAYGMYFHIANLLLYIIFVALLTLYGTLLMQSVRQTDNSIYSSHTHLAPRTFQPIHMPTTASFYFSCTTIIMFVILNCVKEIIQLFQQKLKYLRDPINLLEWILYITAAIMVHPVFTGTLEQHELACAAIAVFLAWFNFLLYLQRFDKVGIYIVMFLEILTTLIKALLIFSILFIAFALAFYILMSKDGHYSFSTIPLSFIRVFSMMLGEFDILGTFIQPYYLMSQNATENADGTSLLFPQFSFAFLFLFMITMPILLVNLLIGLAVGDIESVRRNAYLKRLAMQVHLHTELERKLPQLLLARVDKEEVIEYPNCRRSTTFKWFQPLLRKWFGSVYTNPSEKLDEFPSMQQDDYIYEEMYQHRQKLKEVANSLKNIRSLVCLIVQKMEIQTESNDCDEGDLSYPSPLKHRGNKWSSPTFRNKVRSITTLLRNGPPHSAKK